jgi:hypothetical protein
MPPANTRRRLFGLMFVLALGVSGRPAWASPKDSAQAPQKRSCPVEAVERSICIVEALLADVRTNYKPRGGGGISAIVQKGTNHYQVQISQEGRVDVIDYEVAVSPNGTASITSRKESSNLPR